MEEVAELHEARERRRETLVRGPQLCRVANITYRQLDYWARTDTLVPVVEARGSGTQRRYTCGQVRAARVLGMLSEMGARHEAMGAAARVLESLRLEDWTGSLLVWPDGDAQLVDDPREVLTGAAFYVALDVIAAGLAEVHPAERAAL